MFRKRLKLAWIVYKKLYGKYSQQMVILGFLGFFGGLLEGL